MRDKGGILGFGILPLIKRKKQEQYPYLKLLDLQTELIEHKFPTSGVSEQIISHAGDIYRTMTHNFPDGGYAGPKLEWLKKYIRKGWVDQLEYEREIQGIELKRPGYKEKRDQFMKNLQILIEQTNAVVIEKKRKDVMLASLDMIKGLVKWYETNYYDKPRKELETLIEKMDHYFETRE